MCREAIERVQHFECVVATRPQAYIDVHHVLHGGIYSRTVLLPAGSVATGAEVKVPTTVAINGDCEVTLGESVVRITGHAVLPASAGRKQAFHAIDDTYLTMSRATLATTIEEAEAECTDEVDKLMSRDPQTRNHIVVTGE